MNECKCGCGALVLRTFKRGHQNKRKFHTGAGKCKCGCGEDATRGAWKQSHWLKGRNFPAKPNDSRRVSKLKGRKLPENVKTQIAETLRGRKRPEISGSNHVGWIEDREDLAIRRKMYKRMRRMIGRMFEQLNAKKPRRTYELGYTPQDLMKHLESLWKPSMSWENYGKGHGKWNIDHVRPVTSFPIDSHPAEVNALANLQPLWYEENMSKFNHWNQNE